MLKLEKFINAQWISYIIADRINATSDEKLMRITAVIKNSNKFS